MLLLAPKPRLATLRSGLNGTVVATGSPLWPRFGLGACAEHELKLSSLLDLTRADVFMNVTHNGNNYHVNRNIQGY